MESFFRELRIVNATGYSLRAHMQIILQIDEDDIQGALPVETESCCIATEDHKIVDNGSSMLNSNITVGCKSS